jgi:hypothetical protein
LKIKAGDLERAVGVHSMHLQFATPEAGLQHGVEARGDRVAAAGRPDRTCQHLWFFMCGSRSFYVWCMIRLSLVNFVRVHDETNPCEFC